MERGINTRCLHLEETEGKTENYGAISYPIYQTAIRDIDVSFPPPHCRL